MSDLLTNAPVGLKNIESSTSYGKALSVVAAWTLAEIGDTSFRALSSWNSSGDPDRVAKGLSAAKEMLSNMEIDPDVDNAFFTTIGEYPDWLVECLKRNMGSANPTIQIGRRLVLACNECEGPFALSGADAMPVKCSCCESTLTTQGISEIGMTVMTMQRGEYDESAQHPRILSRPGNWKGQFLTIPDEILISRRRSSGVPLDSLGLSGLMLDERVVNAGVQAYGSEVHDTDTGWSIVNTGSMRLVAPYLSALGSERVERSGFIGMSRMPVDALLQKEDIEFDIPVLARLLAILSLNGNNWSNEERLREIVKYYGRASTRVKESGAFSSVADLKKSGCQGFNEASDKPVLDHKFIKDVVKAVQKKAKSDTNPISS